jgi:hypothetical protein
MSLAVVLALATASMAADVEASRRTTRLKR